METIKKHSFFAPERRRHQVDCSSPIITDQSDAQSTDINYIMEQFQKTGQFTHVTKALPKYQDNTLAIPLEQAQDMLNEAKTLFMQLPAQLRSIMQNDPTKLHDFISNPENTDLLIKYKLIKLTDESKQKLEESKLSKSNQAKRDQSQPELPLNNFRKQTQSETDS